LGLVGDSRLKGLMRGRGAVAETGVVRRWMSKEGPTRLEEVRLESFDVGVELDGP